MGRNQLPTDRAFLVQLSAEVDETLQEYSGRLEHLDSGLRGRFDSREEFFALLERMLRERTRAQSASGDVHAERGKS